MFSHGKKRQRKQTSVWTNDENNALVFEVEKNECIWNPMHEDYKNGKLKKILWERIQATDALLIRSARECCDRWGVVRTAYKRKIEQKSRSGDGASAEEMVLPEPFCHMQFLISPSQQMSKSPPLAKRRRLNTPSSVNQNEKRQRDVLLNVAMKALQESDEWSEHFAVSASIIRKAVTQFPDMERKFRREIMKFNINIDALFEERQAQVALRDETTPLKIVSPFESK